MLELKRLETKTAIKTRQLELQKATVCSPVSAQSSDSSTFDVSINIYWVPAFHKCEFESYFTCVHELMLPEEPNCLFERNVGHLFSRSSATFFTSSVTYYLNLKLMQQLPMRYSCVVCQNPGHLVAGVSLSQF